MAAKKAPTKPLSKNGKAHPFASQNPKPTRARLVSLLDPLGRKRYSEVERYLANVNGASSGLFFYEDEWGWAVRYLLSAKSELCTLHLLPKTFEATVSLNASADAAAKKAELSPELRRRISRTKAVCGVRWVRLPIRSDADYTNFCKLIEVKVEAIKDKKPAKGQPSSEAKDARTSTKATTSGARKSTSSRPPKTTSATSEKRTARKRAAKK